MPDPLLSCSLLPRWNFEFIRRKAKHENIIIIIESGGGIKHVQREIVVLNKGR